MKNPKLPRRPLTAPLFTLVLLVASIASPVWSVQPKDDGYRGIWYFNQPSNDECRYKYSGGFATYPQQQLPFAMCQIP
jgi:hypothetical protein